MSGIGSYLRSLIANLPADSHFQFEIFGPEIDRYTYTSVRRDINYRSLHPFGGMALNQLWHQNHANRVIQLSQYDATLFPAASRVLPPSFKVPGVAVISDILSINLKNSSHWLGTHITKSLSKVNRIVATSQYIRKDLISLSLDPNKIEVVYHGIDHSLFYPRGDIDMENTDIKPFAVQRPYLIYASRISGAAKKHIELIRGFNEFKKKTGLPHRLVLAGSSDKESKTLRQEIAASPVACDILLTGFFPHTSLPLLYACAAGCVFPAINEGVGLPVIEAMASGIPVACTRSGALPEIAGSHAVYFDPDSASDTALAIEKILTDNAFREKVCVTGLEWTKRFSWKQTAEETVGILKKAVTE